MSRLKKNTERKGIRGSIALGNLQPRSITQHGDSYTSKLKQVSLYIRGMVSYGSTLLKQCSSTWVGTLPVLSK